MTIETICGEGEQEIKITDRERDVLEQMVRYGNTTMRDIAEALVVSERTVQTHLANLYRKFGVNNRTSLYRAYTRHRQQNPG